MPNYEITSPTGQKYDVTAPEGASQDDILNYVKQQTSPSGLEAVGRGAEANFPLANQAIAALSNGDYSTNLQQQIAAEKAAKEAQPGQYGVGAVAGAVAPAFLPGVGPALRASPVLGNALLGAAQGISDTDLTKNPGQAVKQAAIGAGVGGAMGSLIPSGEKSAEGLEDYATRKGVEAMDLPPKTLGLKDDELLKLGKYAEDNGLVQGSTQDRLANAEALLQNKGQQIEQIGATAAPLKDATPFVNALHNHLQESASIYGPEANPEATIYRQGLANLSKPNLTFGELQNLKQMYGQRAFDAFGNAKNDAAANVYGQIKDAMKSVIDSSPEEYQQIMDDYSTGLDLRDALKSKLQHEQAGGVQAKGFGLAGKMGAMVTGGNVPATVGLAAGLAPAHPFMAMGALTSLVNNPQTMSTMAKGAASALPVAAEAVRAGSMDAVTSSIMKMINTNPQSLGKFSKPLMQAAQTGGPQGIAATHFILAQQYPEYNEMMMKQSEFGKMPEEDNAHK